MRFDVLRIILTIILLKERPQIYNLKDKYIRM